MGFPEIMGIITGGRNNRGVAHFVFGFLWIRFFFLFLVESQGVFLYNVYMKDFPYKLCSKCKNKPRASSSSYCRDCANKYRRDYIKRNKKRMKEYWKDRYYEKRNDPEEQRKKKTYSKKTFENIKNDPKRHEKRKRQSRENASKNRKSKPWLRAKRAARNRIWNAKKRQGIPQYHRDLNFGCDAHEFKEYIESLWEEGMSWKNYGRQPEGRFWELDHVKACCEFDLWDVEEAEECNHYTNLRPIWHDDHYKKSAEEVRRRHKERAKNKNIKPKLTPLQKAVKKNNPEFFDEQ